MYREAWAVSTVSCLLALAFYFSVEQREIPPLEKRESSSVLRSRNKKDEHQEPKREKQPDLYRDWFERGRKAERMGNLAGAVQCYAWALCYRQDAALEQRLATLRKKLSSIERFWLKASQLQRQGKFQQALDLYGRLDEYAFPKLQTKIEFCRKLLQRERKLGQILKKGDKSLIRGKWDKAINQFRKAIILCEKWPDSKKQSEKIAIGYVRAEKKLVAVQKHLSAIRKYLDNGQTVYALLYAKRILDLPNEGIVGKVKGILNEEMAWIPPGPFVMGSNTGDKDEAPMRTEKLPGYYIDRREVSYGDYLLFVKSTGYRKPVFRDGSLPSLNQPVSGVSWKDAAQYAKWAGKRLPSEAEWEKAARGTDGNIYPWGDTANFRYCNCLEIGIKDTTKVGKFTKGRSPFGCYDMAGNVSEWTAGLYEYYPDFEVPEMGRKHRVTRGGSRYNSIQDLRCSNRYPHSEDVRLLSIGFRCAFSEK